MKWREEDTYTDLLIDNEGRILADVTQVKLTTQDKFGFRDVIPQSNIETESGELIESNHSFGAAIWVDKPRKGELHEYNEGNEVIVGWYISRDLAKKKVLEHLNIKL